MCSGCRSRRKNADRPCKKIDLIRIFEGLAGAEIQFQAFADFLNLGLQDLLHKLSGADRMDLLLHRIQRGGFASLHLAVPTALQRRSPRFCLGREYLQLAGRLRGLPRTMLESKIDEFLRLFSLWDDRHCPVSAYSKGMRQKIRARRS